MILRILSLVGYLGMMGGLLALILLRSLFSPLPVVIALQIAGLLLFFWARMTFGRRSFHVAANPTEGGLVTSGPYHFIRHPIYTAICLFTGAGVASHWSWGAGACGVLVIGSLVMRMFCEETLVAKRYPEYRDYAANTWRMIPYVY